MKPKHFLSILLLLVGTVFAGCNHSEMDDKTDKEVSIEPQPDFTYYNTISIDSIATACGIDSCVLYLPWLNDKINAFLKDSTERKQDIVSSMEIEMFVYMDKMDSIQNTYYCCRLDDYIRLGMGTLWFNCAGDTIWIDPGWLKSEDTNILSPADVYFIHIMNQQCTEKEHKQLAYILLGLFPNGE